MHRILFLPDIRLIQKPDTGYPAGYPVSGLTGYPAGYPAGNQVSGRIPDVKKGRIIRPDIRPAG
jgi:hypothetical protein